MMENGDSDRKVASETSKNQNPDPYIQSDYSVRTKALVSVLTKKNLVNPETIDAVVDYFENKVGPHIGARIVARSWLDPVYRERLLKDARAVAREDNLTGVQGTDLVVVENTPKIHNLVVCTLCSCYPWSLLGLVLKEAEEQGEYDTGYRYYNHWLVALERVVVEKKLTGWEDLKKEGEFIRENDHHRREHQLDSGHFGR